MRIITVAWVFIFLLGSCSSSEDQPPNILFIAVDDLRPELGCYGSEIAKSPVLDELAAKGIIFERAYCQQAICSPSRASLMTGVRPQSLGVTENTAYFRALNPDIVTLPQHFAAHGYETVYCGKIYHGNMRDETHSWTGKPAVDRLETEPPRTPGGYALTENQETWRRNQELMLDQYGREGSSGLIHGPAYEAADVEDHTYRDGYNSRLAIATLKDHLEKDPDKPLFLALGFYKPHLNFVAPQRYWDLYNPEEIELAHQTSPPEAGAAVGLHASFELRVRHGIPKSGPIPDSLARTLLHAYFACVSYIDAQIGIVLDALEESGTLDHTIIVVWGDHGWHLGDMGVWGKATNYEIGTRVPLIISTPGMRSPGRSTDAIVELLDIYPTLCELAGLPVPEHCEGKSLVGVLKDPGNPGKNFAISQFPNPALREWAANPLSAGMRETFFGPLITQVESRIIEQQGDSWDRNLFENHLMGFALRTERYRLVVWRDQRDIHAEPVYVELYDHELDPEETINVAANHPDLVRDLSRILYANTKVGYGIFENKK